jgi:hypothetical protein
VGVVGQQASRTQDIQHGRALGGLASVLDEKFVGNLKA